MEERIDTKEKSQEERRTRREEKPEPRIIEKVKTIALRKHEPSKSPEKEEISEKSIESQKEATNYHTPQVPTVPLLKRIEPEKYVLSMDFDKNLPTLKTEIQFKPTAIRTDINEDVPEIKPEKKPPFVPKISVISLSGSMVRSYFDNVVLIKLASVTKTIETKEAKILQIDSTRLLNYTPQEPKVPLLKTIMPEKNALRTDFDKNLPALKQEIKILINPKLNIVQYTPANLRKDFDASVPEIKLEKRSLFVPKISVIKQPESMVSTYFDKDISMRFTSVKKAIDTRKIGEETKASDVTMKDKEEIAKSMPVHLSSHMPQKIDIAEPLKESEAGEETSSDDTDEEKFFEILLGNGKELKRIEDGKPAVICIEDKEGESIIGVVETVCKRIYREKKGGKPESIIFTTIKEFIDELRYLKAENNICRVELDKKDWNSLTGEYEKRFWNRVEQLFSQGVGFIILNTQVQRLEERHRINVISIKPRQLSIEMKRTLSEIAWGFVKINEESKYLDRIFEDGRDTFERTLKRIEEKGYFALATKSHEGEESDEHLWIKWFLVKHLASELIKEGKLPKDPSRGKIQSKVKTEVKGLFLNDIIPDVAVDNDVYEVETLFAGDGEGSNPSDKITHTIDKYENSNVNSINIVLSNITFIRHLKRIKKILRMYKKDGKENIKFWTLDLKNEKLVSLEEILRIMQEIDINRGVN